MRLFVGIPLSDPVRTELEALCARLRGNEEGLRWAAAESWHVTLQFLGNSSAEQLDCLKARLAELASAPVPVRLDGLGLYNQAGVFIAKVELTPELAALQMQVVQATGPCGFAPEDRPYRPHITLARIRRHGNHHLLRALKARVDEQPAFSAFTAREFLLYESHTGPMGSIYEVQGRFGMGEPAEGRAEG